MSDAFPFTPLPPIFTQAACAQAPAHLFDAEASAEQWIEAKAICDTCPIVAECLRLALDEHRPSFSGGRPVYCAVGQVNAYRHLLSRNAAPLLDMDGADAFALICAEHGVTASEVRGRSQEMTHVRGRVLLELRARAGLSYPALARLVGMHHTSVITALTRAAARAMA